MNRSPSGAESPEIAHRLERVESALNRLAPIDGADGADLHRVVASLWRGKWIILGVTVLCGLIAIAVTLRLPNQYKATVMLMPASDSHGSSLSGVTGQLGGLASLAGLNLGMSDQASKTIAAVQLMKSWGFQEQFIRDNHLEVPLYAAKGWNEQTRQLIIDGAVYDQQRGTWLASGLGKRTEPSGWKLHRQLAERLEITEDKKTGLITLSVEFYSPDLAKQWVDGMVATVNRHMQERDQITAEKSLAYLEEKMSQTNIVEMRAVLSRLIEEQTKNLMLARVNDEYVLRTLSPAKVPEEKSSPNRTLICLVVTLLGGAIATCGWFLWSHYRRQMVGGD